MRILAASLVALPLISYAQGDAFPAGTVANEHNQRCRLSAYRQGRTSPFQGVCPRCQEGGDKFPWRDDQGGRRILVARVEGA